MNGRKSFKKEVVDYAFLHTTKAVSEHNPRQIRRDMQGVLIARAAYGDEKSSKGWNIHHKDHNPSNNNKKNLVALSYESHRKLHQYEK